MKHLIKSVLPGSIAEEMEITEGDYLLSVNGKEIRDVFDYELMIREENLLVLIRKKNGEEWELEIEKDEDEDLGLVFENAIMSDYIRCRNRCIFCFIDQMPPGMRDTLYFKDDDSRLSFLQGNYLTLTNMTEEDVTRIIDYHMEPVNISVHTTNSELRVRMLSNKNAGKVLSYLSRFYEAGLHFNAQIVLCKNWNDGGELQRTLEDLYRYLPVLQSLSVVPVGLTRYRDSLEKLLPITKADAKKALSAIRVFQEKAMKEFGSHYVHASDELYLLAEEELPAEETYDGYPQYENGVGMIRYLLTEFEEAKKNGQAKEPEEEKYQLFATGHLMAPILKKLAETVQSGTVHNHVLEIENVFFGKSVTVSGLLTGQDVLSQTESFLSKRENREKYVLYLPCNMFRAGTDVFLDDLKKSELSEKLGIPVRILRESGEALYHAFTGKAGEDDFSTEHGAYER